LSFGAVTDNDEEERDKERMSRKTRAANNEEEYGRQLTSNKKSKTEINGIDCFVCRGTFFRDNFFHNHIKNCLKNALDLKQEGQEADIYTQGYVLVEIVGKHHGRPYTLCVKVMDDQRYLPQ